MNLQDKHRLVEIEERLKRVRHSLDGIMPIWHQVKLKVQTSEAEISRLEEERLKLQQGQLALAFDDLNF